MISVEEARARILSLVSRMPVVEQPLIETLGQMLARDVVAPISIPPLDNTSMDGYAVVSADTAGASEGNPIALRVTADLAAGYVLDATVRPGEAIRIMTGAPIPPGADAVVPFEETDEPLRGINEAPHRTGIVRILKPAAPGANIRRRGEDVREGQTVLSADRVIRPPEVGVLASLGLTTAAVYRRPVVAIVSTGDEITAPGEPLQPGRIYDANAYSIAALVTRFGGVPLPLGIARDTVEDLTTKLHAAFEADMVVTTAGVSRGDFDVVKDVLAREGSINFWTVRMKPGKPLAFGTFTAPDGRTIPHLGLPGNPVSSMVSFELFGRAAIFTMLGRSDWQRPMIRAVTRDNVVNDDGRRFYARCIVTTGDDGQSYVSLTGPQGSGILTSMSAANGLAIVPEDQPLARAGDELDVMLLD